jgi:acyl carrier protein
MSMQRARAMTLYADQIRRILKEHARLSVDIDRLDDTSDLYQAGLTSLSTVNLMLALEEHFDVEFTDGMLGRKTFSTIRSLSEAIEELGAAQASGETPLATGPQVAGIETRVSP